MSISRRSFLKTTVTTAGSLLVFINIGNTANTEAVKANPMPFIEMDTDGNIIFISSRSDMGQGSPTSLAQILLDEMDADWDKLIEIRETESFKASDYGDDELTTVGAVSTFIGWFNHREAGASLREGFRLAASKLWKVDVAQLKTEKSKVIDLESGKTVHYHDLYESLSTLYLPKTPIYKTREQSNLVGKPIKQLRVRERVTGAAQYGIDVKFPGLKVAVIARCPTFGGKVHSFDASETLMVDGVLRVVEVPSGIAVVAEGFWAAQKGREALSIDWDYGRLANSSSASIAAGLKERLNEEMSQSTNVGDAKTAIAADGGKTLTGQFSFPFVAHATMEPMNATAWVTDDKCEIWAPTQSKIIAHMEVEKLLGRNREDIVFHRTLCGGGFGRRAQEDFVLEARKYQEPPHIPSS